MNTNFWGPTRSDGLKLDAGPHGAGIPLHQSIIVSFSIPFTHTHAHCLLQCYVGHPRLWKMPLPSARRKRSTVSTPLSATSVRKASSRGTCPQLNAMSMGRGTSPESSAQNVSSTYPFPRDPAFIWSSAWLPSLFLDGFVFLTRSPSWDCADAHHNLALGSSNPIVGVSSQGVLGVSVWCE